MVQIRREKHWRALFHHPCAYLTLVLQARFDPPQFLWIALTQRSIKGLLARHVTSFHDRALPQSETDPLLEASLPQRCGNFSMKRVINYTYLRVWNDKFSTAPKIITIFPDKNSRKFQEIT